MNPNRTRLLAGLALAAALTLAPVVAVAACGNGVVESGEQCDQGASNGTATSCCTAACQFRVTGSVCRPGGGAPCDLNEMCTGTSGTCPPDDAPGKAGITCRVGSGDVCDPDETCNGQPGVACPPNVVAPAGTVCRTGSGDICDPDETCTGVPGQACPANVVNGTSTVCRVGSGDICDQDERCSGVPGAKCPPDDAPIKAGVVCRVGSGDVCDQNERCTGVPGATCPPDDAPGNAGVICRPSSAMGAFCDQPERCTGQPGATCPPDDAPGNINVVCRPGSGDMCDPDERCTGIPGQGCPADVVMNPTVVCRTGSGDACDPTERCPGIPGQPCPSDVIEPAGTVCRSATGACDVAERCTGQARAPCPSDGFAPSGTPCDVDQNVCTADQCDGHGTCTAGGPINCEDGNACTQDSCDPVKGCVSTGTPSTNCQPAAQAAVQLREDPNFFRDALKFTWKGGPVVLADLGDPLQTTRYELCVYDASGVRMAMGVPPGSGWSFLGSSSAPRGYQFKDRSALHEGVSQIRLTASSIGKASLKLQGKGPYVPRTTLPFGLPVTAQLYASDGSCWDTEFGVAATRRNEAGFFSGRAR